MAQRTDAGAIPTVLAAAGTEARRGAYYGPQKRNEFHGPVGDALVSDHALDREAQKRLWSLSEDLVGFEWSLSRMENAA